MNQKKAVQRMELMDMSFEMRRNDIISKPVPLTELLQKYPFLGIYDHVRCFHALVYSIHCHTLYVFQLIYEFCKIVHQEKHQLYERWQNWLPKMGVTVRDNISATSLKSLHPYITDYEDFNEPDGN